MKSSALILLGLLDLAAAIPPNPDDAYLNSMTFKESQSLILNLLNKILHRSVHKEIRDIAMNFQLEENLDKFGNPEVVKSLLDIMKHGSLPRNEIFCFHCKRHSDMVIDMFRVMISAKDFATFVKVACYLRYNVNEGMFIYVFTIACKHRKDCGNFYLPPPYEIYPYLFVHSEVIQRAFLLKMNEGILDDVELCKNYGIKKNNEGNYIFDESFYNSRVIITLEDSLRYFTEDIDLNTLYFYFHVEFPYWLDEKKCQACKFRRIEISLYLHQQLLARYFLERLSQDLCDIPDIDYRKEINSVYLPFLRYHTGDELPMRNNHLIIDDVDSFTKVEDFERFIRESIMNEYFIAHDGVKYELKSQDDIENLDVIFNKYTDKDYNNSFISYLFEIMKSMFGTSKHPCKDEAIPSVLDNYETSLRDPLFYQITKRLLKSFIMFKNSLSSYTREELYFPGVKINNVQIDKLITFFDEYYMDMTNAMIMSPDEVSQMKYDRKFLVKKKRLNHEPFEIKIEIASDKAIEASFRVFLGPKMDCNQISYDDINDNRLNFVEIDIFKQSLAVGNNVVKRKSVDMHNVMPERELTEDIVNRLKTVNEVNLIRNLTTGFPQRLLLPKGSSSGMDFIVYVLVTPHRPVLNKEFIRVNESHVHICKFGACLESRPLGFPFDRHIDNQYFLTPNMKFVDVKIFHKDMGYIRDDDNRMFYQMYHMSYNNNAAADSNRITVIT